MRARRHAQSGDGQGDCAEGQLRRRFASHLHSWRGSPIAMVVDHALIAIVPVRDIGLRWRITAL
jgi:hypothetical protein